MSIYGAADIPDRVERTVKDPGTPPGSRPARFSAIPDRSPQRRAHDAFIDHGKPPIGRIATATGSAPVYQHGGGLVMGFLDQFDTATRRPAEGNGAQIRCVDHRLAPDYKHPVQREEGELAGHFLSRAQKLAHAGHHIAFVHHPTCRTVSSR